MWCVARVTCLVFLIFDHCNQSSLRDIHVSQPFQFSTLEMEFCEFVNQFTWNAY